VVELTFAHFLAFAGIIVRNQLRKITFPGERNASGAGIVEVVNTLNLTSNWSGLRKRQLLPINTLMISPPFVPPCHFGTFSKEGES
jgi:hypothetical protein